MNSLPNVFLKRGPAGLLRYGHPWIYKSQLEPGASLEKGGLVRVMSGKHFIGVGYYNSRSEITIRFLTRHEETIDPSFLEKRLRKAAEFRKRYIQDTNAVRLVSSEADALPGLIVDRYGEILVVQFLTLGMEKLKPLVLEALESSFSPRGIYERSDSSSRRIEGLDEKTGWLVKNCGEEIEIYEGAVKFAMKFGEGHKTGFYLDQRENRFLLGRLCSGGEALDAFCFQGGFGLHLARAGARVLGLDGASEAIAMAEENKRLNGFGDDQINFSVANVFDALKRFDKEKRRFDWVILDPPSFTKKKSALEGAAAGYKEIILRGMRILNEGGHLAVFSCSYHFDEGLLMQTALSAGRDSGKSLRVLKFLKQSADHPIDPFIPETYYLKGFLFEVSGA